MSLCLEKIDRCRDKIDKNVNKQTNQKAISIAQPYIGQNKSHTQLRDDQEWNNQILGCLHKFKVPYVNQPESKRGEPDYKPKIPDPNVKDLFLILRNIAGRDKIHWDGDNNYRQIRNKIMDDYSNQNGK